MIRPPGSTPEGSPLATNQVVRMIQPHVFPPEAGPDGPETGGRMTRSHRGLKNRLLLLIAAFFTIVALSSVPAQAADPNKLVQKAIKLYEKGDYDKALKVFVKVLHIDPNHSMAREYMLLCSQKIVEKKLGGPTADTLEKEIAAELHFQENQLSTSTFSLAEPEAEDAGATTFGKAQLPTAQPLVDQSDVLTESFRRRHIGMGNIVQLEEGGGSIEVMLYLNRLFLPFSDILRDESYVVLNHVAGRMRSNPKRKVVLKAMDPPNPAVSKFMPALPSRRCTVVMSYLVYAALLPEGKQLLSTP